MGSLIAYFFQEHPQVDEVKVLDKWKVAEVEGSDLAKFGLIKQQQIGITTFYLPEGTLARAMTK